MINHEDIYDLLKSKNDEERFNWLKNKLKDLEIEYTVDNFYDDSFDRSFNNILLLGNSKIWVTAHFDTVRPEFCANDNTASVINAIRLKSLLPNLNVALLDGEEPPFMGVGSRRLSTEYRDKIDWILNLELTGVGDHICLGQRQNTFVKDYVKEHSLSFGKMAEEIYVPFSDSDIFDQYGIPNVVLFTLPIEDNDKPNYEYIWICHSKKDHPGIITPETMFWLTDNYLKSFFLKYLN